MVDQGHNIAKVQLWGKTVGAISYEGGICAFEYTPEWIRSGVQISPIRLPLSERIYQFPALTYATYKGLPGAFADTLPDDFGNAVIDAWLARSGRDKESFTAVDRLLYTGKRGMGALEYAPAINDARGGAEPIELASLVEMAQQILDDRESISASLNGSSAIALTTMLQVGTSAGGARAKAVIGINKTRTKIRSGQGRLPNGYEHYLLKFDGIAEHAKSKETFGDPVGFGRMEYAYYLMATDAGIDMEHCELLEESQRAHFMTQRFDRKGNTKLHYQSLCAMDHADFKKPGHYSYEQLFSVMRELRLPRSAALQMYRRMVFNVVARNHDDHAKNFGFLLKEGGDWQLAPAFDVAFSYKPGSPWVNSHQISINAKRDDFTRDDLIAPGAAFAGSDAGTIIDEVVEIVSQWPKYAKQAGVFAYLDKEIRSAHRLKL
ncbi:MAG: type II toxin-antitoxin system HipA family toxin [Motiliproteus sp.]